MAALPEGHGREAELGERERGSAGSGELTTGEVAHALAATGPE